MIELDEVYLCNQTSFGSRTIKKIPFAAYANDDDHGNFYSTSTLVLVMTTMATDNDGIG
jgi:hypothetical protein